jgi:hypothetical protein
MINVRQRLILFDFIVAPMSWLVLHPQTLSRFAFCITWASKHGDQLLKLFMSLICVSTLVASAIPLEFAQNIVVLAGGLLKSDFDVQREVDFQVISVIGTCQIIGEIG